MPVRTARSSRKILSMLSQEEVEQIHAGSIHVLEKVGYKVDDAEARQVLASVGAKVEDHVVKIGEKSVVDALESVPKRLTLYSPAGDVLELWGDNLYYGAGCNSLNLWDYETSQIREATSQDVVALTRLADALPGISAVINQMHIVDVPDNLVSLMCVAAIVKNTTKHLWAYPVTLADEIIWIEMAEVINGGESLADVPILTIDLCPTSPLALDGDDAQKLIYAARKRVPFVIRPCAHSGMSAPFTLAGTMVVQNAEALAALVLHQAVNPGAPFIYAEGSTTFDVRTGAIYSGAMEKSLMLNAWAQLGRMYDLPLASNMGLTISDRIDVQNGVEKGTQFFASLLSGFHLLMGAGLLSGAKTMSLEQMVIDHDLFARITRFLEGIQVDEETLALDVVDRVGPGGHFMADDHTFDWMRTGEHYYSDVFRPPDGLEQGSEAALDRAHAKVVEILKEHTPGVPAHTAQQVDEYVKQKKVEIEMGA